MRVGSLVKLKKDCFHNRQWLGFENMRGIIISMSDSMALVFWSDARFKINEWNIFQLTLVQNL
mgnify:CR=1 FL=1